MYSPRGYVPMSDETKRAYWSGIKKGRKMERLMWMIFTLVLIGSIGLIHLVVTVFRGVVGLFS